MCVSKTAIVIVGMALAVSSCIVREADAQVQSSVTGSERLDCSSGRCTRSFHSTYTHPRYVQPDARIIELPDYRLDPERVERDQKWEAFCKPVITRKPPYYVARYSYAHPGCEFGRDE